MTGFVVLTLVVVTFVPTAIFDVGFVVADRFAVVVVFAALTVFVVAFGVICVVLVVVDDGPFVVVFAPTEVVTDLADVMLVSDFALVVVAGAVAVNFAVDCAFAPPLLVCPDFAPPANCFALFTLAAEVVVALTAVVVVFLLTTVSDDFALALVAGCELTVLFVDDVLLAVVVAFALVVRTVFAPAAGCRVFAPTGDVAGFALQWTLALTTLSVADVFARQEASDV